MRIGKHIFPLLLLVTVLAGNASFSQTLMGSGLKVNLDWRQIGNTAIEASLASLASGPVDRIWYSQDGLRLFALTSHGDIFQTDDFQNWTTSGEQIVAPAAETVNQGTAAAQHLPESNAQIRRQLLRPGLVYAFAKAVYRSEDGGLNWTNQTEYRGYSIIGDGLADLAVSPRDGNEIVVAGRYGIWRSLDGGLSWSGLNESLPNLPVRRLLGLPDGRHGTRLLLNDLGSFEWAPGEILAWRPVFDHQLEQEEALKNALSELLNTRVSSVSAEAEFLYAGSADGGRLWSSSDRGQSWRSFEVDGGGRVEDIFVVEENPRVALVAIGSQDDGGKTHILRTINGGIFWDDLTSNLPDVAAHAVIADYSSGSVYAATDAGVFFTVADLHGAGPATAWTPLTEQFSGRPAYDVLLDESGNQLYIAIEGEGVFAAIAPHRFLEPRVVSAADLNLRSASPGGLMSILGRRVQSVQASGFPVPVLAASNDESQIQVPFEVEGSALSLALSTANMEGEFERTILRLPLRDAAPAIFVDREGAAMLLDADDGVFLNLMRPARSGSRIQILATGLGKVQPEWPTGMPAPLQNPPKVVAPVSVFLDRVPVEVTRATLAPGYVGFYLIEIRLPEILNAGPAELYLEAGGEQSNRTRIYLEL